MLKRTESMILLCAAILSVAGCASNGAPASSAKDTPAPQATADAAPASVVATNEWTPSPVKPSTPDVTATAATDAIDVTAVDIYLRGPDFHYARWAVQSDGTLRYADGRHARSSAWGWTGQITTEQAQSINVIAAEWMAGTPKGDDSNGEVWEVRVQGAHGTTTFTVHGQSPSVAEVWSIFDTAGAGLTLTEVDRAPTKNLDQLFGLESAQAQVGDE